RNSRRAARTGRRRCADSRTDLARTRPRAAAADRRPVAGDAARRKAHGGRDATIVTLLLPSWTNDRRAAAPRRARVETAKLGGQAVGWTEAAPRGGVCARRRSGSPVSRRANHRSRSAISSSTVATTGRIPHAGWHYRAHDAL